MSNIRLSRTTAFAALPAIALSLLALTPRPAAAAPGPALPIIGSPTSISIGLFAPSGGDSKDHGGDIQLDANLRYTVPIPNPIDVPARTVIDLGVQTGARHGGHSTVIPLTVGELFGLSGASPNAAGSPYLGVGIGAYFLNQSGLSTATRIGGYGEVGYNFTAAAYIDGKYQFVDHANGLSLAVGLRF